MLLQEELGDINSRGISNKEHNRIILWYCGLRKKLNLEPRLFLIYNRRVNPLNTELNPICHLLALLGPHHILHVSRIRVKNSSIKFVFENVGYKSLKILLYLSHDYFLLKFIIS